MSAYFVTATGTDIGKTFVAAGLIRHWRGEGRAAEALKPVISGFDQAAADASDTGILLTAMGRPINRNEIDRISPWRFTAPLSPDMAARREGRSIDFDALLAFSRRAIDPTVGSLLIEGAGGLMTPLDDRHTMLDWMQALNLPAILVAGSYLGTISHTLSALETLARRNLPVAALVISETAGSTVDLTETIDTIARFIGDTPIVGLPRSRAAFDRLAKAIA